MEQLYTELENLRKHAAKHTVISIIIGIVGVILTFSFGLIGVLAIIGAVVYYFIFANKSNTEFHDRYKSEIVKANLSEIFTDLEFSPGRGIDEDVLEATEMVDTGDRYSTNDYIKAKYKGINFEQADIHIEHEHKDSKGRSSYSTLFKGRWFIFDFNKKFECDLQVVEDLFPNAKTGTGFLGIGKKREKIKFESESFNDRFKVYAESQHEAFYILTPHMMENIMSLVEKTNGKLMLCFVDNKLHIASHNNQDAFEPSLFKPINQENLQNEILGDISVITNFVDSLKLDNTLYKTN